MSYNNLTEEELYRIFELKYGNPNTTGWSPKRRFKWGYYLPGDIYDSVVQKQISSSTKWLDVGGGSAIFPNNPKLSQLLADQCEKLVAVDPSSNVNDNPYAHEKHQCMIEDFKTEEKFDIATFRMVAEHIENPDEVLKKLKNILTDDGCIIIYTINKYSPIPIITYLTPFSWHFKIKKFFWGGEEKDTFPVAYKMNSRKELKKLLSEHGFCEENFYYLDDLSALGRFKTLNLLELTIWKVLNKLGITYPENNLLGVYRRQS